MTQDMINALFEFIAALMVARNVLQVRRDRGYAGIYPPAILFFFAWGLWNLYFYPLLGQWLSFVGGACLIAANLAWVSALWSYGPMKDTRDGMLCIRPFDHDGPCNGFPRWEDTRWCFRRKQ